jgi:ElaB/YqjD/DUF883 family membrane-anchored ribosome-binding protein
MNQTIYPNSASDVPWPTSDHRVRAAETSTLSGSDKAPPTAVDLLKSAAQGAHDTVDRFADRATPAVQRLGDSVRAAEEALHAKAHQLRDTRDEWVEGVRTTVRSNPLVSVAAALAVGAVIARITR